MRNPALFVAVVVISSGLLAYGQGDQNSLHQILNQQFPLTQLSPDRSSITSAGALLQLQKGGLVMYAVYSPMPPSNTYKNGKITQGGSGFGRDLLITTLAPGYGTASNYPHRKYAANETVWVTRISVQGSGITFRLYSAPGDGVQYYADLKLPFDKNSIPPTDLVMARVAEVLTVQQAPEVNSASTQGAQPEPPAQLAAVSLKLPSSYVSDQAPADRLQLNADKSFSLQEGGQPYHGTFTENGARLQLAINEINTTTVVTLQGNSLTDSSGHTWILREASAPAKSVLRNQDIVDLTKAGFDDPTILAQIGSSPCQFDSSTGALIELKKSGVSAAVIKAMVGAGK